MSYSLIFLYLIHSIVALKCYDCIDCPYPWSRSGIQTYGSIVGLFSRVQSCYKKEFYNAVDRRLDRVARGPLEAECRAGKLETLDERSITYCCYSNYCNGTLSIHHTILNTIVFLVLVIFILKE